MTIENIEKERMIKVMTKEIAIHNLYALKQRIRALSDNEALDMAIKALEQELSEDCISRQAVLDIINFENEWLFDAKSHNADTKIAFSGLESRVKALPSVTPIISQKETVEDCISRKSVDKIINKWLSHPDYELKDNIYDMTKMIHKLPSVTPKQKVGKWIDMKYKDEWWCPVGKCLNCGKEHILGSNYCPNCGAKMEEQEWVTANI
jgi:hypothetical protein